MIKKKCVFLAIVLACTICALAVAAAAQTRSDSIEEAFARATQLHQSGDFEGAIRGYQSILAQHPERVDVRSNLGAAFSRLGRYEEAIAQYQKAIALAPERIVHHAEFAKALDVIGDKSRARQQWAKVAELKPVYAQDKRYQAMAAQRLSAR